MRIMTYNIQYGKGRDGQYDIRRAADPVALADIVGLQEIEAYWQRSGDLHQLEAIVDALAERGQIFYSVFGATVDIHKRQTLPDGGAILRRRQFGNAILSRWPILSARTFLFPAKLTPLNAHSIQRGVTEAVIDTPTGLLRVYTSHLSHLTEDERLEQARFILSLHQSAAVNGPASSGDHPDRTWLEDPLPEVPAEAILMGDFNTLPHGVVHALLTGPEHAMYGTLKDPARFVDAWTALGRTEEDGLTLYLDRPGIRGIRIDYIMLSPRLSGRLEDARVLTETEASDHQPLMVTLRDQG